MKNHRMLRPVKTPLRPVLDPVRPDVNPVKALRCDSVEHKLEAVGLKLDGNMVSLRQAQDKSLAVQPAVIPGAPSGRTFRVNPSPIYDYNIHRPGDKVRVWQGSSLVETVVPELAGGSVETCETAKLVSRNLSTPTFSPNPSGRAFGPSPKPEKRKSGWRKR